MSISDLQTLPELVRSAAVSFGPAMALEGAQASANRLTYNQLDDYVCRAAWTLRAHNLVPGDRILLMLEPRPDWAAAFFGIVDAGLIAVPVPTELTPEVVAAMAAHCQPTAVIVSERTRNLTDETGTIQTISIDELFGASHSRDKVDSVVGDVAMLAFTSGSTRQPRAVALTHENLLCNLDALLKMRGGGPGDALLSMLPPAHLFELMVGLLAPLACGARIVYAGPLLPNRIITALRENGITHALAVSALVGCLYEEVVSQLVETGVLEPDGDGHDLAGTAQRLETGLGDDELERLRCGVRSQIGDKFRTLIVGGAAIDPVFARIITAVGIRVEVGYGLTEASPVVSLGLVSECPPGSVGRPLPGVDVRIAADGEILVRGSNVMHGYFRDAATTADVLKDGWLNTGDCGHLDDNGFLFITGRLKEAMVTDGGETIYPEEVEPYYEDQRFAELCVSGLPDRDGNDVPTLFVVPASSDFASRDLDTAFSLLRAAAPARFRVEQMIQLSAPLPRTASGKVRRRLLAQQFDRRAETT